MAMLFERTTLALSALALGMAFTAVPHSALSAQSGVQSPSKSKSLSDHDRAFIRKAAEGGMAEVAMGKLAQEKGQSEQVKQLGERLVQDHSKANGKLKQIAQQKGVTIPEKLGKSQQKEMDKLQKLSGAKFDQEFAKHATADHKKDIKEFQKQAKESKDSDLKNFAREAVPTLQEHLKLAQAAEKQAKNEARSSKSESKASKSVRR